ncbi:MAG: hypothetical protein ACOCQ4_02455, partial [bacterium]
DGGYIMCGQTYEESSGENPHPRYSRIIKLDANGTLQWDKKFGGNQNDVGNSVIRTEDGAMLCVMVH